MLKTDLENYTCTKLNKDLLYKKVSNLVKMAERNSCFANTVSLILKDDEWHFIMDYSGDGIVILKINTFRLKLPTDISLIEFVKQYGPVQNAEKKKVFESILVNLIKEKVVSKENINFNLNDTIYAFIAAVYPDLITQYEKREELNMCKGLVDYLQKKLNRTETKVSCPV
ncbi:hypothetical protein [Lactiplantibacillus plantarum]|uniref:hypothetical protein n=1 Tax=Lactiplantibacillus plantarum TaxID=1590 RepID=UPI001BAD7262|nr:hypothetical protein [Lactiplantibacillus plantarum]MBS0954991.1 hypothetical protein [Lactiplantibacillus plantarum]